MSSSSIGSASQVNNLAALFQLSSINGTSNGISNNLPSANSGSSVTPSGKGGLMESLLQSLSQMIASIFGNPLR